MMRDHPAELIRAVELTPFSRVEHAESFRPAEDSIEQARRTIVRSYMSYGSSFTRTNRDGSCQQSGFRAVRRDRASVAVDWTGLPAAFDILAKRLQGVLVECRDACGLMETHDEVDAVHYVDPPYVHSTRTLKAHGHHKGYRHEMADDDHRRLAETLHRLRGTVIISGYASELYDRELYPKWKRLERKSFTLGARPRMEVLYIKGGAR
jgi:DNA adenine methylase